MDLQMLQGKYLLGELTVEEREFFLNYLKDNPDAPFREERIKKLEWMIKKECSSLKARSELEEKQYNAALEYKKLTEKWEGLGAYFESKRTLTKWFYKGVCYFTWFSGVEAIEHLKSAKQADEELSKILNENQEEITC